MSKLVDELKGKLENIKSHPKTTMYKEHLTNNLLDISKLAVEEGNFGMVNTIANMTCAVLVIPGNAVWRFDDLVNIYENLLALAEDKPNDEVDKAIDKLFE